MVFIRHEEVTVFRIVLLISDSFLTKIFPVDYGLRLICFRKNKVTSELGDNRKYEIRNPDEIIF